MFVLWALSVYESRAYGGKEHEVGLPPAPFWTFVSGLCVIGAMHCVLIATYGRWRWRRLVSSDVMICPTCRSTLSATPSVTGCVGDKLVCTGCSLSWAETEVMRLWRRHYLWHMYV